ncbi:PorV/PorQ family protein [Candidatus Neomarinimicrobiota bacterium]
MKKDGGSMKKIIGYAAIIILSLILITPAHAAFNKVGQTGLQFLKADMSARSAGMGSAFLMAGNDATTMFHNPAGLANVGSGMDAFATQMPWIADITYQAAGLAIGLGNLGVVGVNIITADYGKIIGTMVAENEQGFEETGNLDADALSVGVAYARRLTTQFMVGGQLRYAYQHMASSTLPVLGEEDSTRVVKNEVSGMTYEIGTIFYPGLWPSLRIGMEIKNFSQQYEYEDEPFQLPLTFGLGIAVDAFDILGMDGGGSSLLLALDALHPRDYSERIHLGAEFSLMDGMIAVRGGYKFNYDIEGLTLGAGVNYDLMGIGLKIDYAYSEAGVFNSVNRFTLGVSF